MYGSNIKPRGKYPELVLDRNMDSDFMLLFYLVWIGLRIRFWPKTDPGSIPQTKGDLKILLNAFFET